jgi:prepilin-type N-terminal cleavage/methylation domain-containing protein
VTLAASNNLRGVPRARPYRRRGLTFVEVLIASAILAVAALAALELLSRGDAASLFARRQALAAIEAERILAEAADAVKAERVAAREDDPLDERLAPEALGGCTASVREARELMSIAQGDGTRARVEVVRLQAEIRDPEGRTLVALERVVPTSAAEDAP